MPTPKPGGLHAVSLTTGERAWYIPPPPLRCASGAGCSAALISAPTLIPGVLFSGYGDHLGRPGNVLLAFEVQ